MQGVRTLVACDLRLMARLRSGNVERKKLDLMKVTILWFRQESWVCSGCCYEVEILIPSDCITANAAPRVRLRIAATRLISDDRAAKAGTYGGTVCVSF